MLIDCSAPPPKVCDRNRQKDWLAAEAPAEVSGVSYRQTESPSIKIKYGG